MHSTPLWIFFFKDKARAIYYSWIKYIPSQCPIKYQIYLKEKKKEIYLCENEISIRGEYEQNNIYIQGMETTSLVIFDFANNVWNTSDFTSNVCHTWGLYCWSIKTNRALFNVNWLNQNWVICIFSSIEHLFYIFIPGIPGRKMFVDWVLHS